MGARDRNVVPLEHDGGDAPHAKLHRFAVLFEDLLQQILITRVVEISGVETALSPDGLHGFFVGDVEVLGEVRLKQSLANRSGLLFPATPARSLDEHVGRNAVARWTVFGRPFPERPGVVFFRGPAPTLRVLREFFAVATRLGIGAQKKASPLELDAVAILLFDPAQPNGRVETPGSQVVRPDNEPDGIHFLLPPFTSLFNYAVREYRPHPSHLSRDASRCRVRGRHN